MPNLIPIDLKREYKRLCENIDDEEPSTFDLERSEQYGDIMTKITDREEMYADKKESEQKRQTGRLVDIGKINAEPYIHEDTNYRPFIYVDDIITILNAQPIAYDLEKVVKQLYGLEEHENKYDSYWSSDMYRMTEYRNKIVNETVENAIKIVKGGGVDEVEE